MLETTQNANYSTRGILKTTQNVDYSTVEVVKLAN